ncbi:MAG: DUF4399 domain-containing protein [Myxococcota bacterium]
MRIALSRLFLVAGALAPLACSSPSPESNAPPAAAAATPPAADNGHDHGEHSATHTGSAATAGATDGARVFFAYPQEGSRVLSPVPLAFAVEGMSVSPAGQAMDDKTKGHHHVIVDGGPVAQGTAVPADDKHIHFGKGQTETRLALAPGKHTLTLQFADGAHLSYGPALSSTITIEVVEPTAPAKVFFLAPADGATVKSPVKLAFGLEGMSVRPAGQDPLDKTSGHHHVIVDGEPVALGMAVPADDKHIHFGKGQTETELALSPGTHRLTLQLADGLHLSYGPELSSTITVEVAP